MAACQATLTITSTWSLLKLMSIESVMPSNHLIVCHPLLLLPSIFPSIRSFPMSQFFASGDQSAGVSASTSVLPMNIQDWFPLGLTGWISLQSKGLSRIFSNTTVQKHQFFDTVFFIVQLSCPYMSTGKTIALTKQTFVGKVMSLLFNMLSRLVITFLPRSKRLLISWLQYLMWNVRLDESQGIIRVATQPSHPLSSPSPPAFNLSQHQVFSNESVLRIRWPKYWSFKIGRAHVWTPVTG